MDSEEPDEKLMKGGDGGSLSEKMNCVQLYKKELV